MNSQLGCCCEFLRAYIALIIYKNPLLVNAAEDSQVRNTSVLQSWKKNMFGMWPFYLKPLTCLSCTSIAVNPSPLAENSSAVLFSSASCTPSTQGISANWSHTGIQDLLRDFKPDRVRPGPQSPSSITISVFVTPCLAATSKFPLCGRATCTTLSFWSV